MQRHQKRAINNSLQSEGVSRNLPGNIRVDLYREKNDIRKYLNRMHIIGNKLEQKYIIKRAIPVRKWNLINIQMFDIFLFLFF